MKKILIASSAAPDTGSGISSYAKEISEQFSKRNHQVYYYSPKPKSNIWYSENNINHGVYADQHSDVNAALNELIDYINKNNIHACINNDNPFLQSVAPYLDCVMLSVAHLGKTSVATLAYYNADYIDYIITISNDMQRTFVDKFKQNITKVPIVYNGVAQIGRSEKIKGNGVKLKLFFGGGSNKRKGADIVLNCILDNPEAWSKFELNWCGNITEKYKNALSGYSNVTIHGQVKRDVARQLLEESDLLLFPSREEGCPMMMLEAMSVKVVPIASDGVGAMESMIISGEEGFICSLKSWGEQVIDCLNYLDKNRDVVVDMSENVYKKYKLMFLVERTIDRLDYFMNHPTVIRKTGTNPMTRVLKWHRPYRKDGIKAPFIDRIAIKLGYLRKFNGFSLQR